MRKISVRPVGVLLAVMMFAGCGLGSSDGGGGGNTNTTSADVTAECYTPGDSEAGTGSMGCGIVSSFGDDNANAFFYNEVQNQTSFWAIPANPVILNDCNGANAFSTPDGFILYGVNLFSMLASNYGGDTGPISGVLAHEWGHQIQFQGGWSTSNEPTQRPIELEADAFSGYYMALGPDSYPWQSVLDYFDAIANLGDFNFNDQNHHGTPQERLAAAQLGFQTAVNAAQSGTQLGYPDLHQIFSTSISSFAAKSMPIPELASVKAKFVLSRLDTETIYGILEGRTRGKNAVIQNNPELRKLYPRP